MEALGDQSLPMTQANLNYGALTIVYGLVMIWSRSGLHARWYVYLAIGLLDALAFVTILTGMEFTSVTSMGVLVSSGVISSIPLTYCMFKPRFRLLHYIGVVLSIAGIVLLVLSDKSAESSSPHVIWGDMLLILGNFLYAVSSILMEKVLKTKVPYSEVICMMSLFGYLFTGAILLVIGEYKRFIPSSTRIGLLRSGVVSSSFVVYSLCPAILEWSGTTVEQLSFLSTAVWAVPIKVLTLGGFGSEWWIFMVAALLTVVGILLYIAGGDVYAASAIKEYDLACPRTPDHGVEQDARLSSQETLLLP